MEDTWVNEAREEQQRYFELLGNREWDEIAPGEWRILRAKVGFGLYDAPDELPSVDNDRTGYSPKKLERIDELCEKLTQPFNFEKNGIHFACLFVIARIKGRKITLPIFKSESSGSEPGSCIYVDTRARVYKAWHDCWHDKTLPVGAYCAPFDGFYAPDNNNKVALSFHESEISDGSSTAVDNGPDELFAIAAKRIMRFSIINCSENRTEDEDLHKLDVYEFTTSLLFFRNVMADFDLAKKIIIQVQKDTLKQYRKGMSPRAMTLFDKHIDQLRGTQDHLGGNTQVIKNLSEYTNVRALYEMMADENVDCSQVKYRSWTQSLIILNYMVLRDEAESRFPC